MKRTLCNPVLVLALSLAGLASAGTALAADDTPSSEATLVDINHADAHELTELPGVGEKVAERIVSYREENGPFEKVEELMNVRGIGEKTFLKLKPLLTLGDEPPRRQK